MKKFRLWEIALLCGLVAAMMYAVSVQAEQADIADKLIRLHIVANSDSEEDQALKLLVRDEILAYIGEYPSDATTADEEGALLLSILPELEGEAERVLCENGCDLPVRAELVSASFPTKEYDSFSLPGGEYGALRLTIGEGGGQNWWCVLFPPLCTAVSTEEFDKAASSSGLSDSEIKLIKNNTSPKIKFKLLEFFDFLKNLFNF